jgi:hypothetical protein
MLSFITKYPLSFETQPKYWSLRKLLPLLQTVMQSIAAFRMDLSKCTGLARFERATYHLGGGCSILLSYSPNEPRVLYPII